MSGIVPDNNAGAVLVTDALGDQINNPPQVGLFNNYNTSFIITGGLFYLKVPIAPGGCGGTVTPGQINFIESELLALAQAMNPSFVWNTSKGNNLALAYKQAGGASTSSGGTPTPSNDNDTVNLFDAFDNPLGHIAP